MIAKFVAFLILVTHLNKKLNIFNVQIYWGAYSLSVTNLGSFHFVAQSEITGSFDNSLKGQKSSVLFHLSYTIFSPIDIDVLPRTFASSKCITFCILVSRTAWLTNLHFFIRWTKGEFINLLITAFKKSRFQRYNVEIEMNYDRLHWAIVWNYYKKVHSASF